MRSEKKRRLRLSGRAIGILQDIAIVALIVSAVLMAGGRAGFGLSENLPGYAAFTRQGDGQQEPEYGAAAEPMCVVVTPESGVHDTAMYDANALEEAYRHYSAALAEALGSAGEPESVSDEEWEAAISGRGVYFDYYTDCQLSSFAIWLGSDMDGTAGLHSARRLCLSLSEDEVTLYYWRKTQHEAYRCTTELSVTELSERIAGCAPDGSAFAFELYEELEGLDPYIVVVPGEIELRSIEGANSLDAADAGQIMSAFGMNSNLAQNYMETDGTAVYLEGETTLRLGSDGLLRLSRGGGIAQPARKLSPADAVQTALDALDRTVGLINGVAELRLSYIFCSDAESGSYTLRFDYAVDGLPVRIAGRSCAAELSIVGSEIVGAEIAFRSYGYTGETERPLPAELALAVARAEGGGEPRLEFVESEGSISARWEIV